MKNLFAIVFLFSQFASGAWLLEGYLPNEELGARKIFVVIDGKVIKSVSETRPDGDFDQEILEESFGKLLIFPGLVDLHNHLEKSVLPLWNRANGQFVNSTQWRIWDVYRDEVNGNNEIFKKAPNSDLPGDTVQCAAFRYGKLKSLIGGATAVQGIRNSNYHKCGQAFANKSVELPGMFSLPSVPTSSQQKIFSSYGFTDLNVLDPVFTLNVIPTLQGQADPIRSVDSVHEQMATDLEANPDNVKRRYLGYIERRRNPILKSYEIDSNETMVHIHIGEGKKNDAFNRAEYKMNLLMGTAKKGLAVVHGMGLDESDLKHAATEGISIIWSPFSNLLLYGETLDIEMARSVGVNIALGSDWSPSGTKSIIDEMKIAKRHLKKNGITSVSDKDLVMMATKNAMKALQMENFGGEVVPEKLADLTLVKVDALSEETDAYTALIDSTEKNRSLVVVNGEPLYGDTTIMKKFVPLELNGPKLELLPKEGSPCGDLLEVESKALFLIDQFHMGHIDKHSEVVEALENRLAKYRERNANRPELLERRIEKLNPLLACEDPDYVRRMETVFSGDHIVPADGESVPEWSQNLPKSGVSFTELLEKLVVLLSGYDWT